MKISDFSIKELITIINGDCGFTPYLSGPQLVKLFNKVGIGDVYSFEDGRLPGRVSRKDYVKSRLKQINDKKELKEFMEIVINSKAFIDENINQENAAKEINKIIINDKYNLENFNGIYKIISKEIPEKISTKIQNEIEVENKVFYNICIKQLNYTKCELNINSYEKLKNDYLKPYLKGDEFLFDKSLICRKEYDVIEIIKLNKEVDINPFIFGDNIIKNIPQNLTKEIITKVQKEIDEEKAIKEKEEKSMQKEKSNKIFIVHGHDNDLKNEVARFLETDLKLEAVILHEQPNNGRTIIEKLLDIASNSQYAIVLYTSCDEGRKKGNDDLKHRARQNVVLEHGLSIGILGREKVAAIVKGDIEKPSDVDGLLYIPYLENWKYELTKELKSAGLDIK